MFAIILNLKIDAAIFAQRRQYRRDKAVAPAAYRSFFAIQRDLADEEAIAASVGGLAFLIIDQREGLVRRQAIMALERRPRSEEHTSELQSLMRISYAVFCLTKHSSITNKTQQIYDTSTV